MCPLVTYHLEEQLHFHVLGSDDLAVSIISNSPTALRPLANETSAQPWSSYALHLSSLSPPALVIDGLLAYLLYQSIKSTPTDALVVTPSTAFLIFFMWLLFTKTVKLLPYFFRYPSDIKFLPVSILFGYLHGFLKAYTLLTVHKVRLRWMFLTGSH